MDPKSNLESQLSLSKQMLKDYEDTNSNGIDQDDAARLAELVLALNDWLSHGGFLPPQWERK